MDTIDLVFQLQGKSLPSDHGYALYSAICRIVPAAHSNKELGIFQVRGASGGTRVLLLSPSSRLRIRLPARLIPLFLPLAGKALTVDTHSVRIGVPNVEALRPAASLKSELTVLKFNRSKETGAYPEITPERFIALAQQKLTRPADANSPRGGLGLTAGIELSIPLSQNGRKPGEPARRVIRVKEKTEVGYALIVSALMAEESIALQEQGLGGRRLMGCGLFLPSGE